MWSEFVRERPEKQSIGERFLKRNLTPSFEYGKWETGSVEKYNSCLGPSSYVISKGPGCPVQNREATLLAFRIVFVWLQEDFSLKSKKRFALI